MLGLVSKGVRIPAMATATPIRKIADPKADPIATPGRSLSADATPNAQFSKSIPANITARKNDDVPVSIAALLMFSISSSTLYMRIVAPIKNIIMYSIVFIIFTLLGLRLLILLFLALFLLVFSLLHRLLCSIFFFYR